MSDHLHEIIHIADFAADMEALRVPPAGETPAAFTHRIVNCAVRHLVNVGLLVVPEDIEARLQEPISLDWSGS